MCWVDHDRSRRYQGERAAARPEPDGSVRVSDADRQRTIDELQVHTADGRLTLDEFEGRVGEAWQASTHAELAAALRELPSLSKPSPRREPAMGVPAPLLVAVLVLVGSLAMSHFAWWLIPVGFWVFGGGCAPRPTHRDRVRRQAAVPG